MLRVFRSRFIPIQPSKKSLQTVTAQKRVVKIPIKRVVAKPLTGPVPYIIKMPAMIP
jgi:hypothetical protein